MKVTSIELEKDINDKLRDDICNYYKEYGVKPTTIIISEPFILLLKAKYIGFGKEELNCQVMQFHGLSIVTTLRENIIEVF